MSLINFLKTRYQRKSFFDPTKNYSQLPHRLIKKYAKQTIINIGAGKERLGKNTLTLDRYQSADITADATHLPVKSNSVNLALSIAVLEHLKEPYRAITEIHRILKRGGEVYLEIPFLQPFHSSPHDYFRATLPGLKHWCRHFKEISSGVCVGPGSAVSWLEIEYQRLWFAKIPLIGLLSELIIRAWTLPLKLLDKYLINHPNAPITASAFYFHGKKIDL